MIKKNRFLKKYNIPEAAFRQTKLLWRDLTKIYADYEQNRPSLEPFLDLLTTSFRNSPRVHSIKARLKEPEHLIEKIIRNKLEDKSSKVDLDNYRTEIKDLIGIRALHLFKEDWIDIHNYIVNKLDVQGPVTANIRRGDPPEYVQSFRNNGCQIAEHPFGYRSVHYHLVVTAQKEPVIAEVQVRTVFEEGWSEIDHSIRYPYVRDNPILEHYLIMFNRLAGCADEMGSFIQLLSSSLKRDAQKHGTVLKKRLQQIEKLKKKIHALQIDSEQKDSLISELDEAIARVPGLSRGDHFAEGEPVIMLPLTPRYMEG